MCQEGCSCLEVVQAVLCKARVWPSHGPSLSIPCFALVYLDVADIHELVLHHLLRQLHQQQQQVRHALPLRSAAHGMPRNQQVTLKGTLPLGWPPRRKLKSKQRVAIKVAGAADGEGSSPYVRAAGGDDAEVLADVLVLVVQLGIHPLLVQLHDHLPAPPADAWAGGRGA